MLNISNLSVNFSGDYLFKGVNFVVNKKDRIGLVGKNGVGKSTILKVICGLQTPFSGQVDHKPDIRIAYLPQEISVTGSNSVFDETKLAFSELNDLEKRIEEINRELEQREDYESSSYHDLLDELNTAHTRLSHFDADKVDSMVEKVLKGLGFNQDEFERSISTFSGGWQMRVELAKLLLTKPDVLLLDEPTNHLDIESILWVESFFKSFEGALMLISHDRMFLDNVTNRTIEIVNGRIYDYKAPYSKFLTLREERLQQQEAAFKNQQQYIKQQERFIERFRAKNTKAKQVQSKIKQLDKIERIQFDEVDDSTIRFLFPPAPRSGELVAEFRGMRKAFGDNVVFEDVDLKIVRGERLAFVGKNGMGKSTMVRILVGQESNEGLARLGHKTALGYYAQIQENTLDQSLTVMQTVENEATGDWTKQSRLRGLLGSFLFKEDDIDKKVKVLSGGEKSRLALAKLILNEINLLILDEPTNHLDMSAKEMLKNALLAYDGTLIVVSHDRSFLQGLTDRTIEFQKGQIKEHLGSIDEFLNNHSLDSFREFEEDKKPRTVVAKAAPSQNKISYEEKKETGRRVRQLQKEVRRLERSIEDLEANLDELEAKLSDPSSIDVGSNENKDLFFQHAELKREIDRKMAQWERASNEKESLESKL